MKVFQLSGDEKRIYFQNLDRTPAEEELSAVLNELKAAAYKVSEPQEKGLDDVCVCKKDSEQFDVLFTGEESIIYSDEPKIIEGLIKIFELST